MIDMQMLMAHHLLHWGESKWSHGVESDPGVALAGMLVEMADRSQCFIAGVNRCHRGSHSGKARLRCGAQVRRGLLL